MKHEDTDRRAFLRAAGLSVASLAISACDSSGPARADRALRFAERINERIERRLVRHTRLDRGAPGAAIAGNAFPSYYVSEQVPVWDATVRGAWRLQIGGLVERPISVTFDDLIRRLPRTRQRVSHFCVEGWTAVAEFTGVQMRALAELVRPLPAARCVDFRSFDDDYHESWDLESALHPQTLVVYAKDSALLTPAYGAPARVHSPVKLGYKNTKYLTHVDFVPAPNGGYWSDAGYEWFGGT